jgi:hypothetical protein
VTAHVLRLPSHVSAIIHTAAVLFGGLVTTYLLFPLDPADYKRLIYRFSSCCFVRVRNLVSHTKQRHRLRVPEKKQQRITFGHRPNRNERFSEKINTNLKRQAMYVQT